MSQAVAFPVGIGRQHLRLGTGFTRAPALHATCRLVVGDQEVDNGYTIASSKLFVGDARARWQMLLRSRGIPMNPWLSREGNFIVWEEEGGSGGLRVGRLEVQF